MDTFTFTLQQHTPLIHFQHHQDGATLRATEVKPKLDRFIIERLANGNFEQGLEIARQKNWMIGVQKTSQSLNYKLDFEKHSTRKDDIDEKFPCFFGNMGDENAKTPKKFIFATTEIKGSISTFINTLKAHIEAEINTFWAIHNFGTRQSKGFGSFYIKTFFSPTNYYFDVEISGINSIQNATAREFKKVFESIDLFHKIIRSGVNYPHLTIYIKSALFSYYKDINVQWDKRSIKKKFFDTELKNQNTKWSHPDILAEYTKKSEGDRDFLVRDLLGLATESDWKGRAYSDAKISKEHLGKEIERMASSIMYKPRFAIKTLPNGQKQYYYRVYIYPKVVPAQFLGQTFKVISSESKQELLLDVPVKFSPERYLYYLCTKFELEDNFANAERNRRHPAFKIFQNLQENYRYATTSKK